MKDERKLAHEYNNLLSSFVFLTLPQQTGKSLNTTDTKGEKAA